MFWQQVLTDLRKRGVKDILMLVCDDCPPCRTRSRTCGPKPSGSAASFT
ncbi:transposase [Streptomyces sp. WAC8370]